MLRLRKRFLAASAQLRSVVAAFPGKPALSELVNGSTGKTKGRRCSVHPLLLHPQPSAHLFDDRFNARLLPRAWAGKAINARFPFLFLV
jgi:hypothetical protein